MLSPELLPPRFVGPEVLQVQAVVQQPPAVLGDHPLHAGAAGVQAAAADEEDAVGLPAPAEGPLAEGPVHCEVDADGYR